MEQTLQDLGDLVLLSLPTTLLLGLLVILLNSILFKPLAAIIAQRDAATKGAIEEAHLAIQRTKERLAEYEWALRAARGEILRQQETERQQFRREQAAAVAEARAANQALLEEAKRQLRAEMDSARTALAADAAGLAGTITAAVVKGSRS